MADHKDRSTPHEQLLLAIQNESLKFQEYYVWLENAMANTFFDEVSNENIMLITHSLMGFHLQGFFSKIHLKHSDIVLCLESADADLRILKDYAMYGIKNYQTYISKIPPPFPGVEAHLRIAQIFFTEPIEYDNKEPLPKREKEELRALVKQRNPEVTDEDFEKLIGKINKRFLRALPIDRLILVLDMFFRAKTRDNCQYEVRYNEDWEEKGTASMQLVLAWRNTPKHNFLYRLARVIHRHGLVMRRVNVAYLDPYSKQNIFLMALGLHGSQGQAVWDVCDISDFLREFVTVKYFASFDLIDEKLIKTGVLSGKMGNLLRAMVNFVHQGLVYIDPYLYTVEKIEEDLCRHPELTAQICEAFKYKFDPDHYSTIQFKKMFEKFIKAIDELDTGHIENDTRRKNVLKLAMNMVNYTYKTNFYRLNYTAVSFRIDPKYLDQIPFDRVKKFPELPYGIIYIKGMHFFGFHIRFKDLSRGGLRTVYPTLPEHIFTERNNVFAECYNLAYTQQKKNKDIPEGGSKGVIFLKPWDRIESEAKILKREMIDAQFPGTEVEKKLDQFRQEQKIEALHQAQRSYVESMITILNCEPDGTIRAKNIVDYWKRPEYIYLGPDENMHDDMILWIADFSKKYGYRPGPSFISSKPKYGINHKEYGVTSLGVNVYMHKLLEYLGIDPSKEPFTVKMSGGPDGDVAGNQIKNLHRFYYKTAKLIALTDVSGTIYDPEGLDLDALLDLFNQAKPIRFYPPEKLHEGGFLLDRETKRSPTPFVQQTLCYRKKKGQIEEDWLSGSEMNHLFRENVHQTHADVFIPCGGRPRTLNVHNVEDYLDKTGEPTSKGIVEGANLYLTPAARRYLEEKGVLVIRDSSANKGGVICSSFEVLCGLVMGEEEFYNHKEEIVKEILKRLEKCAADEANLMLKTLKESGGYLTQISEQVSSRINEYTYEILDYLDPLNLSEDPQDPLVKTLIAYALPTLRKNYQENIIKDIPDHHKKAIIACHLAAHLVYQRGLDWRPSIVDILSVVLGDQDTFQDVRKSVIIED